MGSKCEGREEGLMRDIRQWAEGRQSRVRGMSVKTLRDIPHGG